MYHWKPRHTLSVPCSKEPSGAYTDCPAVPEIVTDAPTAPVQGGGGGGLDKGGAIKQRIQSSHIPLRHRHMVIATNLSSLSDLLHCSTPQTRAECCLELTAVSGYRMFLGLFG